MSEQDAISKEWHKWGRGPDHYYHRVQSERYEEGEYCAVCRALPSAPWHPPNRRQISEQQK
jgi:hypothetical protein